MSMSHPIFSWKYSPPNNEWQWWNHSSSHLFCRRLSLLLCMFLRVSLSSIHFLLLRSPSRQSCLSLSPLLPVNQHTQDSKLSASFFSLSCTSGCRLLFPSHDRKSREKMSKAVCGSQSVTINACPYYRFDVCLPTFYLVSRSWCSLYYFFVLPSFFTYIERRGNVSHSLSVSLFPLTSWENIPSNLCCLVVYPFCVSYNGMTRSTTTIKSGRAVFSLPDFGVTWRLSVSQAKMQIPENPYDSVSSMWDCVGISRQRYCVEKIMSCQEEGKQEVTMEKRFLVRFLSKVYWLLGIYGSFTTSPLHEMMWKRMGKHILRSWFPPEKRRL